MLFIQANRFNQNKALILLLFTTRAAETTWNKNGHDHICKGQKKKSAQKVKQRETVER